MDHVHDHAAMVDTSSPVMHNDHPTGTDTLSSGQGFHMMMMAVSISFIILNVKFAYI
jgi:hypothetical protein